MDRYSNSPLKELQPFSKLGLGIPSRNHGSDVKALDRLGIKLVTFLWPVGSSTTELRALLITSNAMFSCGLILQQLIGTIEVTVIHDALNHKRN